jgi:hypothetical protein
MKRKTIIFIFSIVLVLTLPSCRRECRHIKLKKIKCEKGYERLTDVINYTDVEYFHDTVNCTEPCFFQIANQAYYDLGFSGHRPFGDIDFNQRNLIGMFVVTDWASEVDFQSYICYNDAEKKWIFTTEYTLKDQCKGALISNRSFSTWFNTPKIPDGYTIEFNVVNINPFQY